ncbi:4-hydroxythreonine-4-phosphate dehydrogenase PdxA [Candidatus Pelagibacter sp.]|nr:4-hydroxythreonine-4-phosphate dehydrogenase PdxA [Candidatus Pelagibacter sp.]
MNNKPIIIVGGEPYGVFFEIFFKSKKKINLKRPIILIASKKLILLQMKKLGFNFKINTIDENKINFDLLDKKKINLINVDFQFSKIFDKISNKSNSYINQSFNIALKILKENRCAGLINGPVSKKNFLKGKYLGITEFLANKTNVKNSFAMLIYNKKISVSPITTHLPLKVVHKFISKNKIINNVKIIVKFYKKYLKKIPRIAVTGLNPHCESNFKSSEEEASIKPAIDLLLRNGYDVKGPFATDTLFMKEHLKKYDLVIGMYHDQVLTPIKTLFGFQAINITLGLPFIRVSPDHGPNESMQGKNLSDPKSLIEALKFLDK